MKGLKSGGESCVGVRWCRFSVSSASFLSLSLTVRVFICVRNVRCRFGSSVDPLLASFAILGFVRMKMSSVAMVGAIAKIPLDVVPLPGIANLIWFRVAASSLLDVLDERRFLVLFLGCLVDSIFLVFGFLLGCLLAF